MSRFNNKVNFENKKILICPLDWGLGHAARCVPLIKFLVEQKNSVTIACTAWQKHFFSEEVSGVTYVELFGYNVRYSSWLPLWMMMLWQYPKLFFTVKKENKWLRDFLKENKIDVVISDNRYGLHNENGHGVFITHQLFIRLPYFEKSANRKNHSYIEKFDACWVPDFEGENNLSGELSRGKSIPKNVSYIGPLSRFEKNNSPAEKKFDLLILLSGVEPQRSVLEKKMVELVSSNSALRIALVRGTDAPKKNSFPENFTVLDLASTKQLKELFSNSEYIICRPGYSTLMDLHAVGAKALLIPTPGQTEQEYLAKHWEKNFGCKIIDQNALDQKTVLNLFRAIKTLPLPS